jgi:hypothetical protein
MEQTGKYWTKVGVRAEEEAHCDWGNPTWSHKKGPADLF